ncbi:MAG: HAD family hydrolase [bacterium]
MELATITTIVYDFDGTLATCPYDFAHMRRVVLDTAAEFGIPAEHLQEAGLLETIEAGGVYLAADEVKSAAFRKLAMLRLCELEYEAAGVTELLPGVVEMQQLLRDNGYRLGIVTRNSYPAVKRIIGDAPLAFDALLCRDHVEYPKPDPAHVIQMLQLLGSTADEALMVGDHPMDIAMGKAAHMRTVAVLTGQSNAAELTQEEPDYLLPSVIELARLLLNSTMLPHNACGLLR